MFFGANIQSLFSELSLSNDIIEFIDNWVNRFALKIIRNCFQLNRHAGRITVDANTVKAVISIHFPIYSGVLIREIDNTLARYFSNNWEKGCKKSIKAGLVLPPPRFHTMFKNECIPGQKIGETAAIALATVIEYFLKSTNGNYKNKIFELI